MTAHIQPYWSDACVDVAQLISEMPVRSILPRLVVVR